MGYVVDKTMQLLIIFPIVSSGEIVYAPLPGLKVLVINTHEAAQELLSKRPNSTAGRFIPYLVAKL
jgi:hypothetical protein